MAGQVLAQIEGVREDAGGFDLLAPDGTGYRVDITEGVFSPDNPLLARYVEGRRAVAFVSPTVHRLYGSTAGSPPKRPAGRSVSSRSTTPISCGSYSVCCPCTAATGRS
jgi:hypothetical protein